MTRSTAALPPPSACFAHRHGMSVGLRLASVLTDAGSRDAALAALARSLATETEGSTATWRRSNGVLIFVAAEGFGSHERRQLVAEASPWRGTGEASRRKLNRTFARIAGVVTPTSVDLDLAYLLLSERCPEVEASRAELAAAIAALPAVDPTITLADEADASEVPHVDGLRRLTPREREILDLISLGLTTAQIADRLLISAKTVKTHVQNMRAKLGVASRVEAVAVLRHPRAGGSRRDTSSP